MARIMLVDDEENILKALRRILSSMPPGGDKDAPGNIIEIYTSPHDAFARAKEGLPFDIVISDYRMPEMDGVAFLKTMREIQPDAVRFIMSGYADLEWMVGAINEAKIQRFIAKPWDDYNLCADIRQALELQNLQIENRRLADEVRQQQGIISLQDLELSRLEMETPGITKVRRAPDGSVLLDENIFL
jgi:DNA-binding NtrC family response regulator